MTNPERVYWDSSVFIAFLKNEPGRADICRLILEAAERGEVKIVTSAFTLAEVIKQPERPPISEEQERFIQAYFEREFIVIINVDRFIGNAARRIARDFQLKPADAVHVATATAANVDVMHSYDDRLRKKSGLIGNPPLRIEEPTWQGQKQLPFEPAS